MINEESNRNAFINNNMCNINGTNSLKHLLDDSEEEFDTISASTYSDVNSLADLMSSNNSNFSILSLNVQSINAKFDELKITIEQINQVHTISVIDIQESWLENDSNINLYQLDNYNLISKSKYSSEHGGLLIYVHTEFEYEPLPGLEQRTTGWEQLFVNIIHKKKYIIGNVYRVPNEIVAICNGFTDDFSGLLSHLQTLRHPTYMYISGDFNINLLKNLSKASLQTFF